MAKKITSFKKALSWRLISVIMGIITSLVFFEEMDKIIAFNISYHVSLTVLYYLHERMWEMLIKED